MKYIIQNSKLQEVLKSESLTESELKSKIGAILLKKKPHLNKKQVVDMVEVQIINYKLINYIKESN